VANITTTQMTAEAFFVWANRPENADRFFELEDGEVIEVPPPGEAHGLVCWFVISVLTDYVRLRGSGHLLTNDSGLIVRRKPDTVRGPDIMLFLENRSLEEATRGHTERVPPLVVEVFSPTDRVGHLNRRIEQYHRRGIPLVWIVYPTERTIDICRPKQPPKTLDETDELTGNGVLPDFRCAVAQLFGLPGQADPTTSRPPKKPPRRR